MLEYPEDLGNAVKIRDRIIPAVNIQVKKFENYDLYFEILFESGLLWVCWYEDEKLWVDIHHDFANNPDIMNPDCTHVFQDWELFLNNYKLMNLPARSAA